MSSPIVWELEHQKTRGIRRNQPARAKESHILQIVII